MAQPARPDQPTTSRAGQWHRARPVLALLGIVLFANSLSLTGAADLRPVATYGEISTVQRPGLLPGLPLIDPNAGWLTEALGASAARTVLSGDLPWWDPNVGLGAPLAGSVQSAAFYPPTLLQALPHGAVVVRVVLELATALGALALLRRLGARPTIAVPAAACLALCGTAAWFGHGPALVLPTMPLVLLGVEHARAAATGSGRGGVALLAIGLGLSLLAGFPETALLQGVLAAVWALARAPWHLRAQLRAFAARLTVGALLATALAAPALLALWRLLQVSNAGSHSGDGFAGVHLPLQALPMLVLPYVHGPLFAGVEPAPTLGPLTGSLGGFVPPGLLVLALLGLRGQRLRALRLALAALAAVLLARTGGLPVVTPIVDALPLMSMVAVDRYASPVLSMVAVVLAALGMEDVAGGRLRPAVVLGPAAAVLAVVGLAGGVAAGLPSRQDDLLEIALWASIAFALVICLAVAGGVAAGGRRGRTLALAAVTLEALVLFALPQASAPSRAALDHELLAFLQKQPSDTRSYSPDLLHANYGTWAGVRTLQYTDALIPEQYLRVRRGLSARPPADDPPHTADRARAGLAVTREDSALGLADVVARPAAWRDAAVHLVVVQRDSPLPARSGAVLRLALRTSTADVYRVLGAQRVFSTQDHCAVRAVGALDATVRCSRPATLVHRTLPLPGWTASVNGTSRPVLTDGPWLAVDVPAGPSAVTFTWAPPGATASVVAALGALLLTALSCLVGRAGRKPTALVPLRPAPGEGGRGVAVLIPCKDEAATIAAVVRSFRRALPLAEVVVCDNASVDGTARRAASAGGRVVSEPVAGKGRALRRLLAATDADVYVLVDGDGTYDAAAAPALVAALRENDLDMVVGARVPVGDAANAHRWGNAAITRTVRLLYGGAFNDVLSGYRVLSRRFVDSDPLTRQRFEVEAELTAKALRAGLRCRELPTAYGSRPPGSSSKLRAGSDGLRILTCLVVLRLESWAPVIRLRADLLRNAGVTQRERNSQPPASHSAAQDAEETSSV